MDDVHRGKVVDFEYKGGDENRGIRPMVDLYCRNRIYMFPKDRTTIFRIRNDITDLIEVAYIRMTDNGYIERQMVEEFHNAALVFNGYCQVDDGEIWNEYFNDYYIMLFRYILELGNNYNKRLVARLLTESGLIGQISKCIYQLQGYHYEYDLFAGYLGDRSIEEKDRNMLCFMSYPVCESLKDEVSIDIMSLSSEEIITGIKNHFFTDSDSRRLAEQRLLSIMKKLKCSRYNRTEYDMLARKIINLHIDQLISLNTYSGYIEDHPLYMLLYRPEAVDYSHLPLSYLVDVKSQIIIDNAIEYGDYVLYRRVREKYLKDMRLKFGSAFKQILSIEKYKYLYGVEKKEARLRCRPNPQKRHN